MDMNIKHVHGYIQAWTRTCNMDMYMDKERGHGHGPVTRHGHGPKNALGHGHAERVWTWTCSLDMDKQRTWSCSMDNNMQNGHGII